MSIKKCLARELSNRDETDKELESLIQFWKDNLAAQRLLVSPSTIYLVEQTISNLEELKQIKEVQDVPD